MFAKMTIKEQYRFFLQQMQEIYTLNEATIVTDWVFESLAGVKRFDIVKNSERELAPEITHQLLKVATALLQHEPVQYVTGEAWFYNMKLVVNESVLIPRPETEELVQLLIDYVKNTSAAKQTILDIGTGSGCIAIAIKKNLPYTNVTAIDVSKMALDIAKQNALAHETAINFIEIDFLDEIKWGKLPKFDIIISNPPYIPVKEKEGMDKNVLLFEPHQALFVPNNLPLLFYEKIMHFAGNHLNKDGKIFMETHEHLAKETAELFTKNFSEVIIKKDMFGKERMVIVSY